MASDLLGDIPGVYTVKLGSTAAIASNGANAILGDAMFVAPFNVRVLTVLKQPTGASEVTVGTATSSASYRRYNLVNGSTDGSGTVIMASLNNTASLASRATRAFSVVTALATLSAGHQMFVSHLTVGAATADGTDSGASNFFVHYQRI